MQRATQVYFFFFGKERRLKMIMSLAMSLVEANIKYSILSDLVFVLYWWSGVRTCFDVDGFIAQRIWTPHTIGKVIYLPRIQFSKNHCPTSIHNLNVECLGNFPSWHSHGLYISFLSAPSEVFLLCFICHQFFLVLIAIDSLNFGRNLIRI